MLCTTSAHHAAACVRHPYLAELSCDALGAGTIHVNTLNGLQGSPPFCAAYNLVRSGGSTDWPAGWPPFWRPVVQHGRRLEV